jgi:hypothetical protein
MRKVWATLGVLAAGCALAGIIHAQPVTIPTVSVVNGTDYFQDIQNGPQAPNTYATGNQLAAYVSSQPGSLGFKNVLIGGDATTNLFQRGTTGSSVTTTATYGGPDRWAYWSGASTAMTVSRTSATTDIPASNYKYAFKMARTSGQTGVVQVCMAQEVESNNTYQFQGNTAELDFHAIAGSNYSPASSNLQVYIITGTGTDEGISSLAFGLNAGGGGGAGWAGQANAIAGTVAIGTSTTNGVNRYTAIANIPSTATEIAVAICFTPVGTAGTNDYVALAGIQLTRNNNLSAYNGTVNLASAINASSFERRPQEIETGLQQRYYYSVLESASTGAQQSASGNGATTTTCQLYFPFPVNMRAAPTFAATVTITTWTITHVATATALSSSGLAVLGANTVNGGSVTATVASGLTAGQTCVLTSANGAGSLTWSAEL